MRAVLIPVLSLICLGVGWAQAPAVSQIPAQKSSAPATGPVESRTERIHVEDADARIDELRIGGETKSITVQPKGGMPAYDIAPVSGERSWKIMGF